MNNAAIIGIINQPGGTRKTTAYANLGNGLVRKGKKELLVDCDLQDSLTFRLGHPQLDILPVTLNALIECVLNDSPIHTREIINHGMSIQAHDPGGKVSQAYHVHVVHVHLKDARKQLAVY